MLSRHAENLFWIGRYIERAEDTARLLDVTYHSRLETESDRPPELVWAELLEMLFLEDQEITPGDDVGALVMADRAQPSSVVSTVSRARENARTTREWLSIEVWEMINDLYHYLDHTDLVSAAHDRPYEVLRTIKIACHSVSGAIDSSMPRGEGYRFLQLGQFGERALISARALNVWHRRLGGFATQAAYTEWVRLLRSVSAYEAYLRSHRAAMEPSRVLSFLIQSAEFPRSVVHCLSRVDTLLAELGHGELATIRAAGRLRSEVAFADLESMGEDLGGWLVGVEHGVAELASELETAFFRPASAVFMHSYEVF